MDAKLDTSIVWAASSLFTVASCLNFPPRTSSFILLLNLLYGDITVYCVSLCQCCVDVHPCGSSPRIMLPTRNDSAFVQALHRAVMMTQDAEHAVPYLHLNLKFPTSSSASSAWAGRGSARVPGTYKLYSLAHRRLGRLCHVGSLHGRQVHQHASPASQGRLVAIFPLLTPGNDALD